MKEFEPRTVSGGAINMFGSKHKNEALNAHNGKSVLVAASIDMAYETRETHIVVLTQKHELICVMHQ